MRNQWGIWVGILAIFGVVLLVLNWSITQKNTQAKQKAGEEEFLLLEPDEEYPDADFQKSAVKTSSAGVESALTASQGVNNKGPLTGRIYTIQACSFKDQNRAQAELKRAQGLGLPAYLEKVDLGKKGVWFRIYIGEFSRQEEINALIPRVKNIYKNSFMLIVDKGK